MRTISSLLPALTPPLALPPPSAVAMPASIASPHAASATTNSMAARAFSFNCILSLCLRGELTGSRRKVGATPHTGGDSPQGPHGPSGSPVPHHTGRRRLGDSLGMEANPAAVCAAGYPEGGE